MQCFRKILLGKGVFFCALLILVLVFVFPGIVNEGTVAGLNLWFQVVVPALLPFIIFSGVMVRMGVAGKIGRVAYPVLHRLFRISQAGCYPVVIGMLSGYPLGAKTVADLCREGSLNVEEGQYLLVFCNNASPMFMLEYMGIYCMGLKEPMILLGIVYLAAWINAFLYQFHFRCYHSWENMVQWKLKAEKKDSFISILDESILDGFLTVTRVGGYIILFSVLAEFVEQVVPGQGSGSVAGLIKMLGLGMIEITTGGEYLKNATCSSGWTWILGAGFCAFGGLSSVAQTSSVIRDSGLSVKKYLCAKLKHGLITSALAGVLYMAHLYLI